MNSQLLHVLEVNEENLLMIARCHGKSFGEIEPIDKELGVVNFSLLLLSVPRAFDTVFFYFLSASLNVNCIEIVSFSMDGTMAFLWLGSSVGKLF